MLIIIKIVKPTSIIDSSPMFILFAPYKTKGSKFQVLKITCVLWFILLKVMNHQKITMAALMISGTLLILSQQFEDNSSFKTN